MPNFEYCSSLFSHIPTLSLKRKLLTCFSKAPKRILYIDLYNKTDREQYTLLNHLNILPLFYRFFLPFYVFFNASLNKNRTNRPLRTQFSLPLIKKNVKRFSLEVTAIKLLNIFHEDIFENKANMFKSLIKMNIQNEFAKLFFNENQIFVNKNNLK